MEMEKHQHKKVVELVKNECANYDKGYCVAVELDCPQIVCKTALCPYFRMCVLPLDKKLFDDLVKVSGRYIKKCERCNNRFYSKAKNTRFCSECSKKQNKDNKKLYMRRARSNPVCGKSKPFEATDINGLRL